MMPKITPAAAAGLAKETWTMERTLRASAQVIADQGGNNASTD